MKYEQVKNIFKNSSTVKMADSNNAAKTIFFLHNEFRENNEESISNFILVQKLADCLDELNYHDEKKQSKAV